MGSAWSAERAMDREQDALDRDLETGFISPAEHRKASRELQRDLQAAYEEAQEDARERVRDEWGW